MASSVSRKKALDIAEEFKRMLYERYPEFKYDEEISRTDAYG